LQQKGGFEVGFELKPGTYVVAVSGGVDSMALLHMLQHQPDLRLIVAHYDHGIRPDSHVDRQLVQRLAYHRGLPFVYHEGKLGPEASEEAARESRYDFLRKVRKATEADAIITAHHKDDVLETAIHNMLRGTGRKGLVSLRSRAGLHRPLLHMSKAELIAYAKGQGLVWREDSTNADTKYRRNHIRHNILPKFSTQQREELLKHIRNLYDLEEQLEYELINHLHMHPGVNKLDRHWFIMLPHNVAREVMAMWLRRAGVQDLTSPMLERLVRASKTYRPNKLANVDKKYVMRVTSTSLALIPRDR
jgi:tRNA(Ile)-lysidine synthase